MRALAALSLTLAVLATSARAEAPFKVGPGGTHPTIQSAVDAALAAGGNREIRVRSGTFPERLTIRTSSSTLRSLLLSGGWDAAYGDRPPASGPTVVDAGRLGAALVVESNAAHIAVQGLTLRRGDSAVAGGIWARLAGFARLTIEQTVVRDNTARDGAAAGLDAALQDDALLWVEKSLFLENRSESGGAPAVAGAKILATGNADVVVRGTDFTGNEARATGSAEVVGSALRIDVSGSAAARVEDGTFLDNRSISAVGGPILALGRLDSIGSTAFIGAWRNRLLGSDSGTEPQVYLEQSGPGTLVFGDSIVALGTGPAVRAGVAHGAEVFLTNLTLTENGGAAVQGLGGGTTNLSNTILFDNGGDASGVVESRNLREDPLFVDPDTDAYWYHLRPGSPAIDAGGGGAPGGLGRQDIDREGRVRGPRVDIGADEAASPLGPFREPACTVLPFAGASTPVCRCVSELDLRFARCGALLDDLILSARVPLDAPPFASVSVPWTILPLGPVGGPYSMSAALLTDGQWLPQQWQGPAAAALKEGQPVQETFVWKLPAGAAPVRTTMKFTRPGFAEPSEAMIEVTLPEPPK
jgi:hypothetical protein